MLLNLQDGKNVAVVSNRYNNASNLTGPRFEPKISRFRDERVNALLTTFHFLKMPLEFGKLPNHGDMDI